VDLPGPGTQYVNIPTRRRLGRHIEHLDLSVGRVLD